MGLLFCKPKKGIKRVSADIGLMFTAFNLRRLINIIDKNRLKQFLKELAPFFALQIASLKLFAALTRLYIPTRKFCFFQIKTAI
jgi:hypothetical protein